MLYNWVQLTFCSRNLHLFKLYQFQKYKLFCFCVVYQLNTFQTVNMLIDERVDMVIENDGKWKLTSRNTIEYENKRN